MLFRSGERVFAQIRLEEPLPLAYRDQFIVRSYSPAHVIGGGTVLVPHPRRRTNLKPEEHTMLEALDAGNVEEAIGAHLELAALPETAESIARVCGLEEGLVADALTHMGEEARVATVGKTTPLYARPALLQKLTSALERAMLEFHSKNPRSEERR